MGLAVFMPTPQVAVSVLEQHREQSLLMPALSTQQLVDQMVHAAMALALRSCSTVPRILEVAAEEARSFAALDTSGCSCCSPAPGGDAAA